MWWRGQQALKNFLSLMALQKFRRSTDDIRRSEIEKFKERKEIPILIASVHSGGEDLNLTEASYVMYLITAGIPLWCGWQRIEFIDQDKQEAPTFIILDEGYYWWSHSAKAEWKRDFIWTSDWCLTEDKIEELITIDEWVGGFLALKKMGTAAGPIGNTKLLRSLDLVEIREKLHEFSPSAFEGLFRN